MAALLQGVLPRLLEPDFTFDVVVHEGKSDLKKSIPGKLQAWGVPGARVVVLIDQDSNECKKLKRELVALCVKAGVDDALVRIVCRALESWVLGDLHARSLAFAAPAVAKKQLSSKYRSPDRLADPVGEVRALVGGYRKVSGARAVAKHLSLAPGANASHSYNVFLAGLRRLIGEME